MSVTLPDRAATLAAREAREAEYQVRETERKAAWFRKAKQRNRDYQRAYNRKLRAEREAGVTVTAAALKAERLAKGRHDRERPVYINPTDAIRHEFAMVCKRRGWREIRPRYINWKQGA